MNKIKKLLKLLICWGKNFAFRERVAISVEVLNWFELDRELLAEELRRKNMVLCCYSIDGWGPLDEVDCTNSINGVPLDAIDYGVAVESETIPSKSTNSQSVYEDKWRRRFHGECNRLRKLFFRLRPSVVVLVQGYEITNAAARWVAIDHGIPLLAVESTGIKTKMIWDNISGITTNKNLAKNYYWRYRDHVSLSNAQNYCQKLIANTKSLKSEEHQSPSQCFEVSRDKPLIVYLGQVYTDSSIIFGLAGWSSPLEVMTSLCEWCNSNEYNLVIKLHPKEHTGNDPINNLPMQDLTWRKMCADPVLSELVSLSSVTVDHDNSIDTYSLIDRCVCAVTINSQAGLEAAIRGKPVVVCGNAFYANMSFTHDSPHPDYLDRAMRRATEGVGDSLEAQRFTHIFYNHYCRDKTAASLTDLIIENCNHSLH
jgi:hypothetical protein